MMLTGRYRLLQPLDESRTAWRAMDELLHRDVTVRRVDPGALPAVRAATGLKHPSALTVHDILTENGESWIVTEPADGQTLATAGMLPEAQVAEIGLELLDVLTAAHALGIVHGGVEPGAVVRAGDGRFRLWGFGTARPYGAYTPPEPERIPASDLWGLAATLYTLAEGRMPFPTVEAIRYGQPLAPMRAPLLGSVLLPLLHPDPAARPDASALRAALRARIPAPRRTGGVRRVHPALLAAGAVLLAAVTVPVTVAVAGPDPAPGTPAAAERRTAPPAACELLTEEQVEYLVPGSREGSDYQEGACNWTPVSASARTPESLRFTLDLQVELSDDPEKKLAGERRNAGWAGESVSVPGLGDEAFLQELAHDAAGGSKSRSVLVSFRLSNTVTTFKLRSGGDGGEQMTAAALRGAHWVAEAMSHG